MEIVYADPMWEFKMDFVGLDAHFNDDQLIYHKPVAITLVPEEWEDERGLNRVIDDFTIIDQELYSKSEINAIEEWILSDEAVKYAFNKLDEYKEYCYEP